MGELLTKFQKKNSQESRHTIQTLELALGKEVKLKSDALEQLQEAEEKARHIASSLAEQVEFTKLTTDTMASDQIRINELQAQLDALIAKNELKEQSLAFIQKELEARHTLLEEINTKLEREANQSKQFAKEEVEKESVRLKSEFRAYIEKLKVRDSEYLYSLGVYQYLHHTQDDNEMNILSVTKAKESLQITCAITSEENAALRKQIEELTKNQIAYNELLAEMTILKKKNEELVSKQNAYNHIIAENAGLVKRNGELVSKQSAYNHIIAENAELVKQKAELMSKLNAYNHIMAENANLHQRYEQLLEKQTRHNQSVPARMGDGQNGSQVLLFDSEKPNEIPVVDQAIVDFVGSLEVHATTSNTSDELANDISNQYNQSRKSKSGRSARQTSPKGIASTKSNKASRLAMESSTIPHYSAQKSVRGDRGTNPRKRLLMDEKTEDMDVFDFRQISSAANTTDHNLTLKALTHLSGDLRVTQEMLTSTNSERYGPRRKKQRADRPVFEEAERLYVDDEIEDADYTSSQRQRKDLSQARPKIVQTAKKALVRGDGLNFGDIVKTESNSVPTSKITYSKKRRGNGGK
ncbi:hypothetical protein BJ742DRAFT_268415 [Cladochytrium replicatum]|nr:hypothetical protein BJ742DRAFT_268415 [Cladochytrium replicatum]